MNTSIFQGISLSAFSIIQVQGLWSSWIFVYLSSVVVLIAIVRMLMYLFLVPGLSWRSRSQVLCVLCPSVTACAAPQSTLCSLWIRELSYMPALALTWGLWRASCCCGWVKLQAQGMRSEWICFLKSQSFRVWGSAITWGFMGTFLLTQIFLSSSVFVLMRLFLFYSYKICEIGTDFMLYLDLTYLYTSFSDQLKPNDIGRESIVLFKQ